MTCRVRIAATVRDRLADAVVYYADAASPQTALRLVVQFEDGGVDPAAGRRGGSGPTGGNWADGPGWRGGGCDTDGDRRARDRPGGRGAR
ncbi:MAG: hypothetical protein LBG60_09945 [Bifidobacteriaceae bacterium]|nr:hypothetical protein [Bifidobacteriaceae bacterium]